MNKQFKFGGNTYMTDEETFALLCEAEETNDENLFKYVFLGGIALKRIVVI